MDTEKIRKDFPVLEKKRDNKPIIYLDSACMSLKPRQVIEKMCEYYNNYTSCAGRSVHNFANEVTEQLDISRNIFARFFNTKRNHEEIVFTKNSTESINLVAKSFKFKKGDIVLTTDREHNSNLVPWIRLAEKIGVVHNVVPSKTDFTFDIENFQEMAKGAKMISFVDTSNLDGYNLPIKEIIKIAHENGALVMLDGAQSAPHKDINLTKSDVDFFVCSGHKMLGPNGVGVLYGKYHLLEQLSPFILGGETVGNSTYDSFTYLNPPEKFEAGLQNYSGIIGLGAALDYLKNVGMENIENHEKKLKKHVVERLSEIKDVKILGIADENKSSGIVNFVVNGMNHHDVAVMLDNMANIAVRSGRHCLHSWFNAQNIEGSIRASFYLYTTKEECDIFVETLKEASKLK